MHFLVLALFTDFTAPALGGLPPSFGGNTVHALEFTEHWDNSTMCFTNVMIRGTNVVSKFNSAYSSSSARKRSSF